jgi:acetyl esterase/lipase
VLAALLVAAAGMALAQEFKLEPVRVRSVDNVVYGHKDGLALTLDVLIPETRPKNIGVILVVSGSWKSGKPDLAADDPKSLRRQHWTQGLLNGGFTVFLVRHGSVPRYTVPEAIADVKRAIRFVRLHAKEYDVDPASLSVVGASSGGHLALMAGLTADDGKADARDPVERVGNRVQAIVAWFPPTDFINWGFPSGYKLIEKIRPILFEQALGKVTLLESQLRSISPVYQVTADAPPLLLIHGSADLLVPLQQSKLMKARYDELQRPVSLITAPGAKHTRWPGMERNYPVIWGWLDKHVKP